MLWRIDNSIRVIVKRELVFRFSAGGYLFKELGSWNTKQLLMFQYDLPDVLVFIVDKIFSYRT